jgi:uncharacterized protein
MSFDAWVVGFGLSTLARALHIIDRPEAYGVMFAVIAIDAVLLYRFFSHDQPRTHAENAEAGGGALTCAPASAAKN